MIWLVTTLGFLVGLVFGFIAVRFVMRNKIENEVMDEMLYKFGSYQD